MHGHWLQSHPCVSASALAPLGGQLVIDRELKLSESGRDDRSEITRKKTAHATEQELPKILSQHLA